MVLKAGLPGLTGPMQLWEESIVEVRRMGTTSEIATERLSGLSQREEIHITSFIDMSGQGRKKGAVCNDSIEKAQVL